MTLTEYTGQFLGGPDEGNLVTSSVERIPVKETIELWLDGKDKSVNGMVTTGTYIWNETGGYFKWELEGTSFFTRRAASE